MNSVANSLQDLKPDLTKKDNKETQYWYRLFVRKAVIKGYLFLGEE
jgi:hypothetical protein